MKIVLKLRRKAMHPDPDLADGFDSRPSPRPPEPDVHGQAALILAECTLHTLLEANVLTLAQVIETVRTATEVKVDMANETDESQARMRQSLRLLDAIRRSFALAAPGAGDED